MAIKFYLLSGILLLSFGTSFCQKRYTNDGNVIPPSVLEGGDTVYLDCNSYSLINGEKLNLEDYNCERQGYWEIYYPNGNLCFEGSFKNNREIGLWKIYHIEGYLMANEEYVYQPLLSLQGQTYIVKKTTYNEDGSIKGVEEIFWLKKLILPFTTEIAIFLFIIYILKVVYCNAALNKKNKTHYFAFGFNPIAHQLQILLFFISYINADSWKKEAKINNTLSSIFYIVSLVVFISLVSSDNIYPTEINFDSLKLRY